MSVLGTKTRAAVKQALATSLGAFKDFIRGQGIAAAEFTIGTEAAEAITVNIQLKNDLGDELDAVTAVEVFVFANAAGTAFNTQDYTSIAAGTDGAVVERVADKILDCTCEADGDLDIVLTETGAGTVYLGVKLSNGEFAISGAITHA